MTTKAILISVGVVAIALVTIGIIAHEPSIENMGDTATSTPQVITPKVLQVSITDNEVPLEKNEVLEKRDKYSKTYQIASNTYKRVVHSGQQQEKIGDKWYEIEYKYVDEVFGASTTTPSATGDGRVYSIDDADWGVVHGQETGDAGDYQSTKDIIGTYFADPLYSIRRGFFPFSEETLSGTVTGVDFKFYNNAKAESVSADFYAAEATQANVYELVAADYNASTTTSFGSVNCSRDATQWNTLSFNASGITYINGQQASWAKIYLTDEYDWLNTPPDVDYGIDVDMTEGTNDPVLEITYTGVEDTCSCPSTGDWYVHSSDSCYLTTSCDLGQNAFYLLDTGEGSFHIIDSGSLKARNIDATSTIIEVEGTATIQGR